MRRAQSRRGSTAPLQGGSACHVNIPMTVIMVTEKLVYGKGEKKGGDLVVILSSGVQHLYMGECKR